MKWFRKRIWHFQIEHMGNSIHASNACGRSIDYTALAIFWKGHEKFKLITGIQNERQITSK